MSDNAPVRTGLDNLVDMLRGKHPGDLPQLREIADRLRDGAVCGLVYNPGSIDSNLEDTATALRKAGVRLGALFGPEHGATGAVSAGEVVGSSKDAATGLPVYSLYGETKKPTPQMLHGLDCVIFDLQDVGVRFYTFTWTLSYVIDACAEAGIPVIVLDRPNPIGGELIEGPMLEAGLESFVGRYPIPARHGMTSGELARMFAGEFTRGARVEVAPVTGWRRVEWWPETGLDWASPSPNIPTPETSFIYPGACLLEGTNVSEGRGTTLPFRSFGAPWIEPERLVQRLRERTGARWRPFYFTPTASKHKDMVCGGAEWYPPRDPGRRRGLRSVRLGVEVVATIKELWPDKFQWLVAKTGRSHFDLLIGRKDVRERMDRGESTARMAAEWEAGLVEFRKLREKCLLYP